MQIMQICMSQANGRIIWWYNEWKSYLRCIDNWRKLGKDGFDIATPSLALALPRGTVQVLHVDLSVPFKSLQLNVRSELLS